MTAKSKKIFLAATVVVPFLVYCFYYYGMMIKNAPYRFKDFQYLSLKYGKGDSLLNQYNSKTGEYQYLTTSGKLVKKNVKLGKTALQYLHFKAADLGLWNFPANELPGDSALQHSAPNYIIEFHYKDKSKIVHYNVAYNGPVALKDANERLIKEIQKKIDEAETLENK
ncbi:hypothetical protein MUY27_07465 [Mucilaginibacter sp. RS28]|uniref:Uncharacterized protein n=1 Tax=Mucilaginibacter straminoryzae TaxID=2932774 RepID=A0A9X1X1J5_9SPHI|nr:hypothetical protein [Mucilaginibacter straminoryzae]MCJ8209542.1 hypothetical protein [Mucilaginibacter straminoryzae]